MCYLHKLVVLVAVIWAFISSSKVGCHVQANSTDGKLGTPYLLISAAGGAGKEPVKSLLHVYSPRSKDV